jgi:hypothetical protein
MRSGQPSAASRETLRPLLQRYRFNPYRNYRAISPRAQTDVLMAEVTSDPGSMVFSAGAEDSRAAVVARRLSWDSEFFGLPMARIDCVLGDDMASRDAALQVCLGALRNDGVSHVSAGIDAEDVGTAVLLERHGFRLTGGTVTYVARPGKERPNPVREIGRIRPLQAADAADVVALAEEAFRGFRGRFHMDPHLAQDRVEAFYVEWARRCVSFEMADVVLVSEGRDGRLLGFLAFRRREPASTSSGVGIFGGGLGACRGAASGAYLGLLGRGVRWAHDNDAVAEVQTQNYNFAAIGLYEAVGLRSRRADYSFVAWLGQPEVHAAGVEQV